MLGQAGETAQRWTEIEAILAVAGAETYNFVSIVSSG